MPKKTLKQLLNFPAFGDQRVAETRVNILDASLKIIMKDGIQKLSLAEVSRVSRYSKARIVYHYEEMEMIVLELFQYTAQLAQDTTKLEVQNANSPLEKLIGIFTAAQKWMRFHPEFGRFFCVMYSYAPTSPRVLKLHRQILEVGLQRIQGLLGELEIRSDSKEIVATQIHNLMIGTAFRQISQGDIKEGVSFEKQDEIALRMVSNAIRSLIAAHQ